MANKYFTNINEYTGEPTNEVRYHFVYRKKSSSGNVVFRAKSKKQAEKICEGFNKVLKLKG